MLSEGGGEEKGEAPCCQICQSSSAWPLLPWWRQWILLLVLLATVPRQQSHGNGAPRQRSAVSPLMELPLGGPALRHYTRSRPRPHRQNQHLRPSRPQVQRDGKKGVLCRGIMVRRGRCDRVQWGEAGMEGTCLLDSRYLDRNSNQLLAYSTPIVCVWGDCICV